MKPAESEKYKWYVVTLLMGIYACHLLDRTLLNMVFEPIKREFGLSDSQLGLLAGLAYGLPFALAALPMGMLADRFNRTRMLAMVVSTWSLLTALSGLAGNYVTLLLARAGVGAMESGCPPNAVSLVSDYFPERQRSTATAVYMMGAALGMFAAFAVGGFVTAAYGWRMAFFLGGIPGILLGILLLLTVKEPPRKRVKDAATEVQSFKATLAFIKTQRSLLHLIMVIILTAASGAGCTVWAASYLLRFHDIPLQQAGAILAVSIGLFGSVGIAMGGVVADKLGRRSPRGRITVPMYALLLTITLWALVLLAKTKLTTILFLCLWATFSSVWMGPVFGLIVSLVRPRARGMAMAISTVLGNLIGSGMGPQLVGFISDKTTLMLGHESLRYALITPLLFNLWAVFHCRFAMKTLEKDMAKIAKVA